MEQGNRQVHIHLNMKDSLRTGFPAQKRSTQPASQKFNPKQILESLPADATPAQQDSAIQAHLPQRETIRSTRPDTLNLPGWHIAPADTPHATENILFDRNFFSPSPYYHAEINYRQHGMTAEPLPYMLRNDDWVTSILLCCFFVVMIIFAHSKKFIAQRRQDFFPSKTNKESLFSIETGRDMRHAVFLYLQNGLLLGLFFFDYTQATHDLFMLPFPPHLLLGIYTLVCWIYLGIKQLLYLFINWIYFNKEDRATWTKSYSFLVAAEGILLFPLALITVYFNLSVADITLYLCLLAGSIRVLLFYKTFQIFFADFHGILHLIVYFCALELLPLCCLWQALTYTNDILL